MSKVDLLQRAAEYASRRGLTLGAELGAGLHGIVLAAESQSKGGRSALKIHEREQFYEREHDVYLRLSALGVATNRSGVTSLFHVVDAPIATRNIPMFTNPFLGGIP